MEKSISDKNYIIIMIGNLRIWINEKEFKAFVEGLKEGKLFINLGGRIVNTKSILYAGPRQDVDIADKIKKGEWQCEYGFWHQKFEQCGHEEIEKYSRKQCQK